MKHSLTILLLLCSMAVSGQVKFDNKVNTSPISHSLTLKLDSVYRIGSGLKYEGGELMPTPGNSDRLASFSLPFIVNNKGEIVPMPNIQDTVKVIVLATNRTDINKPVQLMQIECYSVTPRYLFGDYHRAYYLNIHKQPMPDDVIVWMSIQR